MLNIKWFLLLLIVAGASMYFALTNLKTADDTSVSNEVLFPTLASKVGDVDTIEVQRGETDLMLTRSDDKSGWTLANRDNYPASNSVVARFLRGMTDIRKLEQKTSDPERYSQLSLGDPAAPDSGATLYRLKSGDSVVAEIISGKSRTAASNPDEQELYIRLPDAPESWLVQGQVVSADNTVAWLDQTIVEIPSDTINAIQVDHPGEEPVIVNTKAPGVFELQDIPDGYKLKMEIAVNDLAGAFGSLDLVDVFADKDTDYSDGITATVDTIDGLRVRMQTGVLNDEPVARFVAMEGPLPSSTNVDATDDAGKEETDEADSDAPATNEAKTDEADSDAMDEVNIAETIEALNERWSGWVYKVRSFKLQNISRKKSELIEEDVPEESPEATDSSPAAEATQ